MRDVICVECASPFQTLSSQKFCCSPECQHSRHLKLRRIRERSPHKRETPCEGCGKFFVTSFPRKRYCSDTCYIVSGAKQFEREKSLAKLRLARFVLNFMERHMPEQLAKLKTACEAKNAGSPRRTSLSRDRGDQRDRPHATLQ